MSINIKKKKEKLTMGSGEHRCGGRRGKQARCSGRKQRGRQVREQAQNEHRHEQPGAGTGGWVQRKAARHSGRKQVSCWVVDVNIKPKKERKG